MKMKREFEGKTAMVTGAGSGIGAELSYVDARDVGIAYQVGTTPYGTFDSTAVALGDPAALALLVELIDESAGNSGHQRALFVADVRNAKMPM